MSFGLKMYRSNGLVAYDSNSVTWNQVDQVYVPAGASRILTYPIMVNKEILVVQMLIDTPALNRKSIAADFLTDNRTGTVAISGNSENAYFWILMR
jgi:hypothetical protein